MTPLCSINLEPKPTFNWIETDNEIMSLKPWREIARPHRDVLEGTFKQSEFAADITQVANGTAPAEYQDAAQSRWQQL